MDCLERVYKTNMDQIEEAVFHRPVCKLHEKALLKSIRKLRKTLTPRQWDLLHKIWKSDAALDYQMNLGSFRAGFLLGARLTRRLYRP